MSSNPFLPKRRIHWRTGPRAGKAGIPAVVHIVKLPELKTGEPEIEYRKDPRGRKPKDKSLAPSLRRSALDDLPESFIARSYPNAGKLSYCTGEFFEESNSGWGSNLDMLSLSHGPVGCGGLVQTSRLNLPGFVQGIESFTALFACTDLSIEDLADGGDTKLSRALDEIEALFPLANGTTILNEDPIALIDANVKGIAKTKTKESGKQIISRSCESIREWQPWVKETAAGLKAATNNSKHARATPYDVAITFRREAAGLVWIVSKLLSDIGLKPVHEMTGSSTSDMASIGYCRLAIGFANSLEVASDYHSGGYAQLLKQWFDVPVVWSCFVGPSATDSSLRAIAARFEPRIKVRAENIITANRKKIDAIIVRYRPRLEGKLVVHFSPMSEEQLEAYRLLGMRIGNSSGWTGKTGVWRKPRLVCDEKNPSEMSIDSYIAEAKPDLVLLFSGRNEYDWRKRGQNTLSFTSVFDRGGSGFWAYDGFAHLAAVLDRAINAPWRRVLNSPWPINSG